MRLAARYAELWVTVDSREAGRGQLRRLDDLCADAGRDPSSLGRLALLGFRERPLASVEAFRDVLGRHAELGFTDLVVHWPRGEEPFRDDRTVLERVAADVLARR
jgi:alkanesulfonate monooxygenase SsuD/methylene tetrahydromethanopterin reductase-like flavin-dependent oxidoreductase (luciferase family)